MNNYLNQANRLYRLAVKELNSAKINNDEDIARDAAGKAWIATTDALRGFLLKNGLNKNQLPRNERQRLQLLSQYGNEKMRHLYGYILGVVHQTAYYEGEINYTFLFGAFSDVKKFIYRCDNGG